MNNRDTNSLKRVIKETITSYKIESFIVLVLIIVSSIANVYGSMFLKSLIDDYIVPLLSQTELYAFIQCINGIGNDLWCWYFSYVWI